MSAENAGLILQVAGLLFLMLALAIWSVLRMPQHAVSVRLWTAGALMLGIGIMLAGVRHWFADWVAGVMLNGLALGSQYLRILALRRHMGLPLRLKWGVWLLALLVLLGWLTWSGQMRPRVTLASLGLGLLSLSLVWHALQASRRSRSRSARLLAVSECPLALMLLLRAGAVWLDLPDTPMVPLQVGIDWALLVVTVVVAAIYSNLAYMGLLLDDSRADERQARHDQAAESASRRAAQAQAQQLAELLQQRDMLAQERQRTLHLLAHEIRQPLHQAGGALQASNAALQALPGELSLVAKERLHRAQAVLVGVRSVLDNTLAAAELLARDAPIQPQEVELSFLVDLVLGDLVPEQRARVQVDWQTDLRSAELEPGLMRLALRNLLVNALQHGGAAAQAVLRIDEQADPPALRLSVQDNGTGMSLERMNLGGQGVPVPSGSQPPQTTGLGLQVVQEVARRHGGHLRLAQAQPHGVMACLVLPLPG